MLGKKREREETNPNDAAAAQTAEDEEEESKSRVIQKKPRLDPFSSTKKKGKGSSAPFTVPHRKAADTPPTFDTKLEQEDISVSAEDVDILGASSSKIALNTVPTSE